ncbi:MAG: mechanosensitive ion channel [Lachnospiraceae bacterium]|nr:mechanosensitive ion channel [Lachnospiraceae bacterium]
MESVLPTVSGGEIEFAETINQLADIDNLKETLNPSVWESFLASLPEKAMNLGFRVLFAAIVFIVGRKLIKFLSKLIMKSLIKVNADKGAATFLTGCVRVALYVILVMLISSSFGVDATSIVAILGSAGLAIGLAIQGSLSNFAGGVLILIIRPFKVGDYIIEDTHGHEGFVTEIQIFHTTLHTIDNKLVLIPNGALCNSSLTNVNRLPNRQLDYSIGISYESDLLLAKNTLLSILKSEEALVSGMEPTVFVRELGDSSVVLGGRAWITSKDYWKTLWHVNETVKLKFDSMGIVIPYNQLDVHLDQIKPEEKAEL